MANLPAVRIKVCGLTNVADAVACARAGVDWIGLNFHPGSPRYIEPAAAAEIVAALPGSTRAVGLFVNRAPSDVARIAEQVGFGIVQLHGDEPPEDLVALGHLLVVRAFRIGSTDAVTRMAAYLERTEEIGRPPDAVLLDAFVPGLAGGTGQTLELELLLSLPPIPPLVLAGGLTPENVAERVARIRPWMVDVASGVETSPGRKDPSRVTAFARAVAAGCQAANLPNRTD